MLFDIGWPELMLIGMIALVVIGPKDLPRALRVAGFWVRKARTLSREFQSSIDQMIREAELDEMREELKKATEFDLEKEFNNTIDPGGTLAESVKPPDIPDFFDETPAGTAIAAETTSALSIGAEAAAASEAAAPEQTTGEPSEEQLPLPFPGMPGERAAEPAEHVQVPVPVPAATSTTEPASPKA